MQKLDMINAMLAAVGENPVTDAESQHPSAIKARSTLSRINAIVQDMPWRFNTEVGITLLPDVQGEIILPANTLYFIPDADFSYVVERGKKLYDTSVHSYLFTAGVQGSLRLVLDPDQCPEPVGQYVSAYATWQHYMDDDGDGEKINTLAQERERMRIAAVRYDLSLKKVNILNRPAVFSLLSRVRPASGYVGTGNPIWPGGR